MKIQLNIQGKLRYFWYSCLIGIFFSLYYLFLREGMCMQVREGQRERETEDPKQGLRWEHRTWHRARTHEPEFMTWAKVRHLQDWATQVPPDRNIFMSPSKEDTLWESREKKETLRTISQELWIESEGPWEQRQHEVIVRKPLRAGRSRFYQKRETSVKKTWGKKEENDGNLKNFK